MMACFDPQAQEVIRCDLCIRPVELYCNPCHLNLCGECVTKHMLMQKSRVHEVVLFTEKDIEYVLSFPKCSSHDARLCDLFCKDCNIEICSKCAATSHRSHHFTDLEEHIVSSNQTCIEGDIQELENYIIPSYEKTDSEIMAKRKNLQGEYNVVEAQIFKNGKEWHKQIDNVVEKHSVKAKNMKKEDSNTLKKYQAEIRENLSLARQTLTKYKKLLKSKDAQGIKSYRSIIDKLRLAPSRFKWASPSFNPAKIQSEHLYRQFGKLNASIKSEIQHLTRKQFVSPQTIDTVVLTKATLWGLACSLSGRFWISGEDATIELLDTKGTVYNTVQTKSGRRPYGIAVTWDGNLVYCDGRDKNIIKVQVMQAIIKTSLVSWTPYTPYGICATYGGGYLVYMVCDEGINAKIIRYDINFQENLEIELQSSPGNKSISLAENLNSDVCFSNRKEKSVVAWNEVGNQRWRYCGDPASKTSEPFDPVSLCTDSQCQILIADCKNHRIHILSEDGHLLTYLDCNLFGPYVLGIDRDDRLYVGENKTPECKVKIIQYMEEIVC